MEPPQTRSFATLAFVSEVAGDPALLSAYASVFGEQDDATLVLYAPDATDGDAAAAITGAAAAAGVDLDRCPDMVMFAPPLDEDTDNRLVRHCRAVLSNDRARKLRHPRPIYTAADVSVLRDFAAAIEPEPASRAGDSWSYEAAVSHLVECHGIPEVEVRDGSVPQGSLDAIAEWVAAHLPRDRPLTALHVGNFVGISLGHLFAALRRQHHDSTIVSVDPNIPHRGVERPQDVVVELLEHFGLSEGHLLVCGYSLEKSLSNDGNVTHDGYDPSRSYAHERSPAQALRSLERLGLQFDLAFIDGNHEGTYLRRELATITDMLRPGGLLVLDDVHPNFGEIADAFLEVSNSDGWPFDPVGYDGRVGLLRRR